jgi:hypothetical protein
MLAAGAAVRGIAVQRPLPDEGLRILGKVDGKTLRQARHKGRSPRSGQHPWTDIVLPTQCKLARQGLKISRRALGDAAKISLHSILRFERGDPVTEKTISAISAAFTSAGVVFFDECGCGPGLMIKGGLK